MARYFDIAEGVLTHLERQTREELAPSCASLRSMSNVGGADFKRFSSRPAAVSGRCSFTGHKLVQALRSKGRRSRRPLFRPAPLRQLSGVVGFIAAFTNPRHSHSPRTLIVSSCGLRALSPAAPVGAVGSLVAPLWRSMELTALDIVPSTSCAKLLRDFGFGSKICLVWAPALRVAWAYGAFVEFLVLVHGWAVVILPSGQLSLLPGSAMAADYNILRSAESLSRPPKTYGARLLAERGRRPKVRGIAKNPCDHPHGGSGDGIALPRTPWNKVIPKRRRQRRRAATKMIQPRRRHLKRFNSEALRRLVSPSSSLYGPYGIGSALFTACGLDYSKVARALIFKREVRWFVSTSILHLKLGAFLMKKKSSSYRSKAGRKKEAKRLKKRVIRYKRGRPQKAKLPQLAAIAAAGNRSRMWAKEQQLHRLSRR